MSVMRCVLVYKMVYKLTQMTLAISMLKNIFLLHTKIYVNT